jgi:tetratricopeptide (TPR) repeat protein
MKNKKYSNYMGFLSVLGVCLLAIISYWASFRYGFFFDDEPTITQNIAVRTSSLKSLFFFCNSRWISFFINRLTYILWKLNPVPYRVIGLTIHIMCGLLIFYFLNLVLVKHNKSKRFFYALITFGLFLLHPLQTQTVTYITQARLEGLVVLFTFIILIFFIKAVYEKNIPFKCLFYGLSFGATVFAAGTKEIIITLPFLIILVDWFFGARASWAKMLKRAPLYVFYFLIIIGMFAKLGRSTLLKEAITLNTAIDNNRGYTITATTNEKIKPLIYCMSQFKVITHYISLFFWPKRLCFEYPYVLSYSFFQLDVLFPFLILLGIAFLTIWLLIINPTNLISFSLMWFFITLLPRASIIPSAEFVADYKTYLPSFGMFLLLSMILTSLLSWLKENIRGIALGICFIFLAFLTYQRNCIWSSNLTFWQDVVEKNPLKPRALNNYAVALSNVGRKDEAIEVYKTAYEVDPAYAASLINLAFHYQERGDIDKAMECYKKAIGLKDTYPQMYNNIGSIHFNRGDYAKAEQCFKTAVKLEMYPGSAHGCLGQVYYKQNKFQEAYNEFETAFMNDKNPIELYYLHGQSGLKLGYYDKSIESLQRVYKHDKNYKDTLFALGSCYYNKGDHKSASKFFQEAHDKNPSSIIIAYNLAQSYLNSGEYENALPFFKQCVTQNAPYPFAQVHRARCLIEVGQKQQARKVLEEIERSSTNQNIKQEVKNLKVSYHIS